MPRTPHARSQPDPFAQTRPQAAPDFSEAPLPRASGRAPGADGAREADPSPEDAEAGGSSRLARLAALARRRARRRAIRGALSEARAVDAAASDVMAGAGAGLGAGPGADAGRARQTPDLLAEASPTPADLAKSVAPPSPGFRPSPALPPAPVVWMDPAEETAPPSAPFRLARDLARDLAHGAADLLYPPLCTWCRADVMEPHALCPACWSAVAFIARPLCERCGAPISGAQDAPFCDHCLGRPLAFRAARAALLYEGVGRDLAMAFKHGDRLDIARPAATWMIRAGRDLIEAADLIAPTPLHWRRLVSRRFNQSAELARRIAHRAGRPYVADLLRRVRATPMQRGLSREDRRANLDGAFVTPRRHLARLQGARVLVVDDVYASGATLSACADALLAAGAGRVDALCLARVASQADAPIFSAGTSGET